MFQARQGDVFIEEVEAPPQVSIAQRRKPENGRLILVRGEATGHHHSVAAKHACYYTSPLAEEGVLVLERPSELLHQEHDAISIPAGTFRVRRQVEYHPEAIRPVAD